MSTTSLVSTPRTIVSPATRPRGSRRERSGTSQNFNGEQFYFYDDTNSKIRMSVQPNNGVIVFPNGSVGIGVTPTAAKLHVSGDAAVPAIYAESSNRGV